MQQKVLELEAEEQERWSAEREQKLSFMQTQLMKKHGLERNAFQKKIQSQLDALKKNRALELERLLQKYQNVRKGVEVQQTLELKLSQKKGAGYSPSGSMEKGTRSSAASKGGM